MTRRQRTVLACLVVAICAYLWVLRCREVHALDYCPVVYDECLNRSPDELRAFLPPWGDLAAVVIGINSRELQDVNLGASGDFGNCGVFHLQPPDCLDLGVTARTERPQDDQRWIWSTLSLLYSDYSAELQAQSWLEIVGPTVRLAIEAGATDEEAAGIAALCNSAPTPVRRWGLEHDWHLPSMLEAYLERRDTRGRRERVRRIEALLGGV